MTCPPPPMAEFPTPDDLRARYEDGDGVRPREAGREAADHSATRRRGRGATTRTPRSAPSSRRLGAGRRSARCSRSRPARARPSSRSTCSSASPTPASSAARSSSCDRDELRTPGAGRLPERLRRRRGRRSPARNAREERPRPHRHLPDARHRHATRPTPTSSRRTTPNDYFSHIVIDECHRSAWGKWSQVLTRNPNAVQIGLTATPRQLEVHERTPQGGQPTTASPPTTSATSASRSTSTTSARASRTATSPPARSSGATSSSTTSPDHERETGLRRRPTCAANASRDAITGEPLTVGRAARALRSHRLRGSKFCCPIA